MSQRLYTVGAAHALRSLGIKTAADKDETSTPGLVAGAAAAGTPFLGMIGERPIIHDPFLNPDLPRVDTLEQLERLMRPGDVLLTTRPGMGAYRTPQVLGQGTIFHHVVPVLAERPEGGVSVLPDSDFMHDYDKMVGKRKMPETTPRAGSEQLRGATEGLGRRYPDAMILRPTEPLTPSQLAAMEEEALRVARKPYGIRTAISNWLRDIFVPKTKHFAGASKVCVGDICSTLPGRMHEMATGSRVLPEKATQHLLPGDFARSPAFKAIAARVHPTTGFGKATRTALRLGTRAALAAILGGAGYGLVKKLTED